MNRKGKGTWVFNLEINPERQKETKHQLPEAYEPGIRSTVLSIENRPTYWEAKGSSELIIDLLTGTQDFVALSFCLLSVRWNSM